MRMDSSIRDRSLLTRWSSYRPRTRATARRHPRGASARAAACPRAKSPSRGCGGRVSHLFKDDAEVDGAAERVQLLQHPPVSDLRAAALVVTRSRMRRRSGPAGARQPNRPHPPSPRSSSAAPPRSPPQRDRCRRRGRRRPCRARCFFRSRPFALSTDSIAWAMLMDSSCTRTMRQGQPQAASLSTSDVGEGEDLNSREEASRDGWFWRTSPPPVPTNL